jgi:hypothetical protein
MMKQFFDFKAKYPEALLLFRCGDFYETYCDDAIVAAQILGITLTHRNNGAGAKGDEMAGFPHHALDTYLPKLIRAGKRVAICDQLEDPKLTKKLVKRGITELVTPGVAMQDTVLNYKENNFLCAVHFGKAACGVAFLDISTGEFLTGEGTYDYVEKLIGNFQPKEVLYDRGRKADFARYFGTRLCTYEMDDWVFTEQTAHQKLYKHFNVKSLKGFGVDHLKSGVIAAGAILQYLEQTLHTQIAHITSISRIEEERYVRLDKFTVRSLELVSTMQEDGKSLLDVIDRTVSPMGGRLLRRWLVFPLKDEQPINERLDIVDYFFREPQFRMTIDDQLQRIGDLERIVSKVAVGRVTPREMVQLKTALKAIEPIKATYTLASGQDITINEAGAYLIQGTATDTTIIVEAADTDKVTLVLENVTIENADFPAIYVKSADTVHVQTSADSVNTLSVTGAFVADGETNTNATIFSKDDLVLEGEGTLNISSSTHGIVSKDDLKVKSGTYVVSAIKDGLKANDELTIKGGTLNITAAEGLEATIVTIEDGDTTINATDDGINATLKSDKEDIGTPTIQISGGTVSVTMGAGDTDALDVNGNLYISGGTVNISGQSAFDFDGEGALTGGTVTVNGTQVTSIENSMMGGMGGRGGMMGGGRRMGGQMPSDMGAMDTQMPSDMATMAGRGMGERMQA